MGFDKAEIINSVLNEQAAETEKLIATAIREKAEHDGAASALTELGKKMPGMAEAIENRLNADTEMSPTTANTVRVYAKNIYAQIQTMCMDNAKHQRHCSMKAEGQVPMLKKLAEQMRKKGSLAISVAKTRAETDDKNRESMKEQVAAKKEKVATEATEIMNGVKERNAKSPRKKRAPKQK